MLPVSIIVGEPVRRISRIGDFEVIGIVTGTMAGAALAVGDEGEGTGVVDLDPGCTGLGEEVRRDAADAGLDILKLSLWNEPLQICRPRCGRDLGDHRGWCIHRRCWCCSSGNSRVTSGNHISFAKLRVECLL